MARPCGAECSRQAVSAARERTLRPRASVRVPRLCGFRGTPRPARPGAAESCRSSSKHPRRADTRVARPEMLRALAPSDLLHRTQSQDPPALPRSKDRARRLCAGLEWLAGGRAARCRRDTSVRADTSCVRSQVPGERHVRNRRECPIQGSALQMRFAGPGNSIRAPARTKTKVPPRAIANLEVGISFRLTLPKREAATQAESRMESGKMHYGDANWLQTCRIEDLVAVQIVDLAVGNKIKVGAANGVGGGQSRQRGAVFEDRDSHNACTVR